jgi:adenylylsulfate kinase
VATICKKNPEANIILDGRTYSKRYQIEALKSAAKQLNTPLRIIECVCSEESSRKRLEHYQKHLAKDRDFSLYQQIKAAADPITEPKLLIDMAWPLPSICFNPMWPWWVMEFLTC